MKKCLAILPLLATLLLSGCLGPLVNHETARTVGASNHELLGGVDEGGYVLKWNYGLTDNFDVGLDAQLLTIGLRAKYAFINNSEDGWSLAAALGIGRISDDATYYQGDLITSYMADPWEPYGMVRYTYLKGEWHGELGADGKPFHDFSVPADFGYVQLTLGTRYWLNANWFLSPEVTCLDPGNRPAFLVGGAVGYRF